MLSGLDKDSALMMREMRDAGAWSVVQDEAGCFLSGMQCEAIAAAAANEVVPLENIAAGLLSLPGRHGPGLSMGQRVARRSIGCLLVY